METAQQRITNALEGIDSENLKKIYVILFDIWCWDSENEHLKEVVDTLQGMIEDPNGNPINTNPPETKITHSSNGITNEIFNFKWGTLSLGIDLEHALSAFIEERLFSVFGGSSMSPLDSQLRSHVDNQIFNHYKITGMESEILMLRAALDELKIKVDSQ